MRRSVSAPWLLASHRLRLTIRSWVNRFACLTQASLYGQNKTELVIYSWAFRVRNSSEASMTGPVCTVSSPVYC